MEKLAYVLWRDPGLEPDAFRDRLLAKLPAALASAGAWTLHISVVDSDVAAGASLWIGRTQPKDALVTFWLEVAQDREPAESALRELCDRRAGYLVVESRPLVFDPPDLEAGARTPGFSLVGGIERRDDLTQEEFVRHWQDVHRDVAIETQSSFSYVRNEVVRALTPAAPPWHAIVEEGFPREALDDPMVFYDAGGSEETYRRHLARMLGSCDAFIAMDRVESHPMSEYRF